jgi:tetratricopeptide (TPR) repeat protein
MLSWVAMERAVEERRATDPAYRKKTEGRPLRADTKYCTDTELLDKLRAFRINFDRPSLRRLCEQALSAQEIAERLLGQLVDAPGQGQEKDWIWICVATLWERWFPDQPNFEMLDDKMQAGYKARKVGGPVMACRIWLDAWSEVVRICDKSGIRSIHEFDVRFSGTESLFNWIQDLEDELSSGGVFDRRLLAERVSLCEEAQTRFEPQDDLTVENRRRALAESYFELGQTAKADALFRGWLEDSPQWGWGWIGWSDCYRFTKTEFADLNRSEQLLREGLSIAGVRDYSDIAERLADLLRTLGREQEAAEFGQQAQTAANILGEQPLHNHLSVTADKRPKVGRNDQCPCGSGRKFKKCCGARNQ